MKHRCWVAFLIIEVLLSLWLYRDALWGGSMLAPLDCGPTLMPKYRFMDPDAAAMPSNHYIIDQFTYDLPLQYTIYQAYRRGEIPWWDPYTYAGRPLLADAHINGTDPIRRLCYKLLPFALAYNWTKMLHSLLLGVGMFFLLRHWRFGEWISIGLALAWQLAVCHIFVWGHPWLQASYLYYPFLWWAWEKWWQKPGWKPLVLASLLASLIFYSGNLQSHSYVVLFAGTFLFGYGGRSVAEWKKLVLGLGVSGLLGAALAAPVLLNQIEFFHIGVRSVHRSPWLASWSGVLSLTGMYPWITGTFRTLDWGKHFSQSGLGFNVFIGSVAFVLAALGVVLRSADERLRCQRRMALWLAGLYFVGVLSTPLLDWLYMRSAGLGVLGLLVLAALALEEIRHCPKAWPRLARTVLALTLLLAALANLEALVIYPHYLPKVRQIVNSALAANPNLDLAPGLREFQIQNFANEVSFKNPETVWATAGLLALAAFAAFPSLRSRSWSLPLLLTLNLVPLAQFDWRFQPRHPIALWERLKEGGPEQKRLCEFLQDKPVRLIETAPGIHEQVLPHCLSEFYRIRMANGYSSLLPRSLFTMPSEAQEPYRSEIADYSYENPARGLAVGVLKTNANAGHVVFHWLRPASPRTFTARTVSLNEVELTFAAGPAGTLVWTDTYFPGWRAWSGTKPLPLKPAPPSFSHIEIPADATTVVLRYRPSLLSYGIASALAGLGVLGAIAFVGCFRCEKRVATQP